MPRQPREWREQHGDGETNSKSFERHAERWFPDTALSTGGDCLSMGNVQPFTIRAQCGYGKHVYSVFDT